jgi:D-alanine transaminase
MTIQDAWACWNGEEMPLAEVRVPALDRGFLFGDAIYEVIRVYRGQPFLFADHLARLQRNFQKLNIPADSDLIAQRARQTLDHSGIQNGSIYIQVTRGEAPRTHHFPHPAVTPNELIYVRALGDGERQLRETGGRAILIPDVRWKRCDIKSTNLLANCLGAEEAYQRGCQEALFVAEDGTLIEGTHTSLFGVRQGAILTAPLGEHVLPGITRKLVLRLAGHAGIPVIEQALHRDRLKEIDELFLTGTTTEILPIVDVEGTAIGSGCVGPIVRSLQQAYVAAIAEECGPV